MYLREERRSRIHHEKALGSEFSDPEVDLTEEVTMILTQ
jgi:hypothetical protein